MATSLCWGGCLVSLLWRSTLDKSSKWKPWICVQSQWEELNIQKSIINHQMTSSWRHYDDNIFVLGWLPGVTFVKIQVWKVLQMNTLNLCTKSMGTIKYSKINNKLRDDVIVMEFQILHSWTNIYLPTKFQNDRMFPYMCFWKSHFWWRHHDVTPISWILVYCHYLPNILSKEFWF